MATAYGPKAVPRSPILYNGQTMLVTLATIIDRFHCTHTHTDNPGILASSFNNISIQCVLASLLIGGRDETGVGSLRLNALVLITALNCAPLPHTAQRRGDSHCAAVCTEGT